MISIEIANLDYLLGELLGALLHIDPNIACIVYLTPRMAFGRLEILENVVGESIQSGTEMHSAVDGVLKKVRSIIQRRHDMIHDCWGTVGNVPSRMKVPRTKNAKPRPPSSAADSSNRSQGCSTLLDGLK